MERSRLKCPGEVGKSTFRSCEEKEGVGSVDPWPIFTTEYCV